MTSLCFHPGGVGQDAESYAMGIMSQEVGMVESEETEKEDRLHTYQSSDLYHMSKSVISACCNQTERGVAGAEKLFRDYMTAMSNDMTEFALKENTTDTVFSGPYVSLNPPVDRRNRCVRKRASSEPNRKGRKTPRLETTLAESLI